ncbi:MAG: hypothetical protein KAW46_11895, partial [candidate division Zixibacteria bacterium]|nr:hypothetical protein [candidate division Zixibacteria bacterium]
IGGAKGVLINVTGGDVMTLFDVNTATSLIYEEAGSDANIIFGAVLDSEMEDQMRVTVIATGIGEQDECRSLKEETKSASRPSSPGQPISLFPDNAVVLPRKNRPAIQPVEAATALASNMNEPEPVASSSDTPVRIGGNGNGSRIRVPLFSEDDLTIPAYIRRLDENS